jgi:hypothetical protein
MLLMLLVNACGSFKPVFYPEMPKDGTPLYRQAFAAGCETGATVYGNDVTRIQNKLQVKSPMMQNKTYRNAWKLGNRYCRFYVSQIQMEGTFLKDFGTPVYPNRMIPGETEIFRERLTDSFWMTASSDDSVWLNGIDWPWSTIDYEGRGALVSGDSIGQDGGVFNLF